MAKVGGGTIDLQYRPLLRIRFLAPWTASSLIEGIGRYQRLNCKISWYWTGEMGISGSVFLGPFYNFEFFLCCSIPFSSRLEIFWVNTDTSRSRWRTPRKSTSCQLQTSQVFNWHQMRKSYQSLRTMSKNSVKEIFTSTMKQAIWQKELLLLAPRKLRYPKECWGRLIFTSYRFCASLMVCKTTIFNLQAQTNYFRRTSISGQNFSWVFKCLRHHRWQQSCWSRLFMGIVRNLPYTKDLQTLTHPTRSIFYFGYMFAEYPGVALLQRFPIAKFLGGTFLPCPQLQSHN